MKKLAPIALVGLVALAGCSSEPPKPPPPSFSEVCKDKGGTFMEDTDQRTVTTLVTGTISGTVMTYDGKMTTGTGTGSGMATAFITITIRQCVVDGDIVDMEVNVS